MSELSEQETLLPIAVVAPAPSKLTETERLLWAGFHPSTACAFRDFDLRAVRDELHTNDLLGWLPREDRDWRIGMLVIRWRRIAPEVLREREVRGGYQEPGATRAASREILWEWEVGSSFQEPAAHPAADGAGDAGGGAAVLRRWEELSCSSCTRS